MRVVGGEWRGHRIEAPPGRDTRPTADRVREAVFSAVEARIGPLAGIHVIDLYAGSGALGIEALSRGAEHVLFVDSDPRAVACMRRNLDSLGVPSERARVVACRAEAVDPKVLVPVPAALLFADPPYRMDSADFCRVLQALAAGGALHSGALVVYEHSARAAPVWASGCEGEPPRRYGDTAVSFAWFEG